MRDLIIIGGGPAGLAAAAHAADLRLDFLLLSKDLGGKCNYHVALPGVEPSPDVTVGDLVTSFRGRLENLPHSFRLQTVESLHHEDGVFSVAPDTGATEESRAVLLATGASTRRLNVPGELRFLSHGLGYSARSYPRLLEGRRVFLAGDSDRVLYSAIGLAASADSVTVLLLPGHTCSAAPLISIRSLKTVTLIADGRIEEFRGEDYPAEVTIVTDTGPQAISADAYFLETELQGNTSCLGNSADLYGEGYLSVNDQNMTSIPGLFAAGDVTGQSHEHALAALGQGTAAMQSARRYLLHGEWNEGAPADS